LEIPDYSYLREDLAKALIHKKNLFNDGLREYSEKHKISVGEILEKIEKTSIQISISLGCGLMDFQVIRLGER